MRRAIKVGAAVAAGTAVGTAAIAAVSNALWTRDTGHAIDRLLTRTSTNAPSDARVTTFSPTDLARLPAPVSRYFSFALTPGQSLIRHARVQWSGEFRLSPEAPWKPFTAQQHFTLDPPGFMWDASIRMAPLVSVRVRDEYVAGEGAMLGKIAAVVPVANQRGTPEMAAGALSRYLGEAVWFPTALLPSAGVTWSALDASSARATLADAATVVSADFHFGGRGEIVAVTMTRIRDVNGRGVATPFEARIDGEHRRVSGMMVPAGGEVAWILPTGRFAYWRGRVVDARYDDVSR